MRRERRRSLTKAELRAMGCAPGLMVVRYRPDGERAEVQELTPEAKPAPLFVRRLTNDLSKASEGE